MVFFQKRLSHTLVLHPSLLGPALPQHAREQLVAEVEGRPVDDDGFIVTVLPRAGSATVIDDAELRHGMVDALSGFVRYKVTYNALMFRPFKHEVLDAVVKSVSEVGFFAEAGPLSILVSHAHIPEDMAYAPADGSYTSGESGVKIRADMPVRVKIIGATVLQSALCAIGSIKEPYLGLLA